MDWVGVEHNRLMDELRRDVRLRRPRDICKAVERLALEASAGSRAFGGDASGKSRSLRQDVYAAVGCKGKRFGSRTTAGMRDRSTAESIRNVAFGSADEFEMSGAAWTFVDRINGAGVGASDPAVVAGELAAIVADMHVLTPDEQMVIEAMASVSLSSFEYWSANADAMAQEMNDAYGDCIQQGGAEACFYQTGAPPSQRGQAQMFQLASTVSVLRPCSIDKGLIWEGDKWGAGVGLAIGLMTKNPMYAIAGVVVGAAAGSGGAATYEFGKFLWCAWHQ